MRLKNVLYSSLVFSLAIILTYGTTAIGQPVVYGGEGAGFKGLHKRESQPYVKGSDRPRITETAQETSPGGG